MKKYLLFSISIFSGLFGSHCTNFKYPWDVFSFNSACNPYVNPISIGIYNIAGRKMTPEYNRQILGLPCSSRTYKTVHAMLNFATGTYQGFQNRIDEEKKIEAKKPGASCIYTTLGLLALKDGMVAAGSSLAIDTLEDKYPSFKKFNEKYSMGIFDLGSMEKTALTLAVNFATNSLLNKYSKMAEKYNTKGDVFKEEKTDEDGTKKIRYYSQKARYGEGFPWTIQDASYKQEWENEQKLKQDQLKALKEKQNNEKLYQLYINQNRLNKEDSAYSSFKDEGNGNWVPFERP